MKKRNNRENCRNYNIENVVINVIYSIFKTLLIVQIFSCFIRQVNAQVGRGEMICNPIGDVNKWSYNMVRSQMEYVFDKMGLICRTLWYMCSGEEYEKLDPIEKKFINIYNENNKNGDYFNFLKEISNDAFEISFCNIGNAKEKFDVKNLMACPSRLLCFGNNVQIQSCKNFNFISRFFNKERCMRTATENKEIRFLFS